MNSSYKTSFLVLLALIFFLPFFFVPGAVISLGASKSALLAVGTIVAFLAFMVEYFRRSKVSIPWHALVIPVVLLPLVYLVSALAVRPSGLSLFGYAFEPGTFGFILFVSALFLLVSLVFSDSHRISRGIGALFLSITILAIFSIVKIFVSPEALSSGGMFVGKTAGPLGSWTSLAMIFGLSAVLSSVALEMSRGRRGLRIFFGALLVVSAFLLAVLNFSTAFIFTLVLSIVMFVYFFITANRNVEGEDDSDKKFSIPWSVVALFVVSLLFVINPVVSSEGNLGNFVSNSFGVSNADVRPSFSTTFGVSKQVLTSSPRNVILGSGPNTFGKDWLIHKPVDINATPFWSSIFPYGVGFVPTQIPATGVVGSIVWLFFMVALILLVVRGLRNAGTKGADNFYVVSTMFGSIFLWSAFFLYTPGVSMLTLAFFITALFLAASKNVGLIDSRSIVFSGRSSASLFSLLLGIGLVIGSVIIGFNVFQKTVSAYHFGKAVKMSNVEGTALTDVEAEIVRALNVSPNDVYYGALARLNFAKANAATQNSEGDPDTNTQVFQQGISNSIQAARAAVQMNPSSYSNWILLGSVYSALVGEPFKVEGSYENAKAAFEEAKKLNPRSPEVPYLLARLEFTRGNVENARSLVREAIALKEDYGDAYLLLTQIEVSQNNLDEAIESAEVWAILNSTNPGVFFELGLLKYSNADYNGSGQAFAQALALQPQYANAKYYLGLSLVQLDRFEEALEVFEDLLATNPESEELKQIIESLEKGENPIQDSAVTPSA